MIILYQCKCCWFSAVQVQWSCSSSKKPRQLSWLWTLRSKTSFSQCMHINRCGLGAKLQMKMAKHLLHEYKFSTVSYHTMIHISRFHIFWHTWTSQGQGKHVKPKYIYIHILPHDIIITSQAHAHLPLCCECLYPLYTAVRLLVAFSKNSTYQR